MKKGTPIFLAVLLQELCKKLEFNVDIVSHDAGSGEDQAYYLLYPSKYLELVSKLYSILNGRSVKRFLFAWTLKVA